MTSNTDLWTFPGLVLLALFVVAETTLLPARDRLTFLSRLVELVAGMWPPGRRRASAGDRDG